MPNKTILILSTGGTIAGVTEDGVQGSNYTAAALSGSDLLSPIQSLLPSCKLDLCEISQIDSIEMQPSIWESLLTNLKKTLGAYDGFVITHGTDTMEETAFALDLLYEGEKPVVLVGAMRPSNALGSDGVKNLLNAIALASDPRAKGVMVLMNDRIYNPQNITKAHSYNLDAFKSRNGGDMGYVLDGAVRFFYQVQREPLPFKPNPLSSLPQVEILCTYAGMQELPSYSKLKGLVVMGCGAGNIPSKIQTKLQELQIPIVVSTRGCEGFVVTCPNPFIPASNLSAIKARILLALALGRTSLGELFARY